MFPFMIDCTCAPIKTDFPLIFFANILREPKRNSKQLALLFKRLVSIIAPVNLPRCEEAVNRVYRTHGNRFLPSGPVPVPTSPNSKIEFEFKKMKKSHKFLKNTSRCVESNGVKKTFKYSFV
jgi:hypothetical protein